MTVSATTLVRRAMYSVGLDAGDVFTNKYDTCRTVKAYGSNSTTRNAQIIAAVEALNIPGLTVKQRLCPTYYGTRISIIARLPL